MPAIEGVRVLDWSVGAEPPPGAWWGGAGLRQWNLSASAAGVLRGLHLHGACDEVYLLLEGAMEAGVCDLRHASPSAGQSACFAVAGAGSVVTVPAGVLHGLYFTRPSLLLTGRSSEHDGAAEWRCRWDDPALGRVQLEPWTARLGILAEVTYDAHEVEALADARQRLRRRLAELA